jgi:membrane protein insertase Oxa1/YidC/SpoIIIJ
MLILESLLISIFEFFYGLTSSYELSLILLSVFVSLSLAPFYYLTGILEKKERTIKQRLEPFMQKISSVKNSNSRHILLKELYWSFSYYPFYSLRSLASLFIQIPMLFAAYGVLTKNPLSGEQFLFIKDLGKPDFLFNGVNALPMVMTAINAASVFISTEAKSKERRQGIFIAMIFFVLLYTQNSALLIYWTFNQLFNFARYAFIFRTANLRMPKNVLATMRSLVIPKPSLLNFALAFTAMAFPAILIYKQNMLYFVGTDLQVYIAFLLAISLAFTLLFKFQIAVAFILFFMFFPIIRQVAQAMDSYWTPRFVCFFTVLYFVHFFAHQKKVLMAFFTCAAIYCAIFAEAKDSKPVTMPQIELPQDLAELELKDSSSIYLFMQDAFPHKDYAKHLNMPNYDEFMGVLEKNGFNVYDVYSLGDQTLHTMYGVFQMTTDFLLRSKNGVPTTSALSTQGGASFEYFRHFLNGNSTANLLLKSKGYKTGVSNIANRWFFQKSSTAYDFWAADKIAGNLLLRAIFMRGKLNSMLVGDSIDLNLELAKFAAEKKNEDKIFAWTTAGPGHSSGILSSGEAELHKWLPDYNQAIHEMQIEIDSIVKNNPGAIIIFMSDHGPYIMDVQRIPKNYDLNKVDYMKFRDIFGAFMAIRFPDKEKAAKYDSDFNVTQDLFSIIFAYLFDSEIPLKYKIKNTELRLGPHKFDKGIFYKDFYKE